MVILFPLAALLAVLRCKGRVQNQYSTALAYMFVVTGGIMGLHRLYFKQLYAGVFIVLFVSILFFNNSANKARLEVSNNKAELVSQEFLLKRVNKSENPNQEEIDKFTANIQTISSKLADVSAQKNMWQDMARYSFYLIVVLLLFDVILLPKTIKRYNQNLQESADIALEKKVADELNKGIDLHFIPDPDKGWFENFSARINHWVGQYIAFWTILAVFVLYYEVVVRYVFNSPTNWAHESMFLIIGAQYMLAGGYALKEKAHVRVDIIYTNLTAKYKALFDIITSVIFFIFILSIVATGWIFFADAWEVKEVSFTEWAVSYWPTKMSIFLGGVLLLLQGVADLLSNIRQYQNQ